MDFFSGNYISALRGCCAMKFLYALEIGQGYIGHWDGVPEKILIVKNRKIWPKLQPVRLNNFRANGGILTGLFSVDTTRGSGDKLGTIFTMPALKNL